MRRLGFQAEVNGGEVRGEFGGDCVKVMVRLFDRTRGLNDHATMAPAAFSDFCRERKFQLSPPVPNRCSGHLILAFDPNISHNFNTTRRRTQPLTSLINLFRFESPIAASHNFAVSFAQLAASN